MVTGIISRGLRGQGVMLTTHFYVMGKLGMSGVILLFHHTPLWRGKRKFYFFTALLHSLNQSMVI
jgi:hypothetical protein